jgi:hypothetical protein
MTKTMQAKFQSVCGYCGNAVQVGEQIVFQKEQGEKRGRAYHVGCHTHGVAATQTPAPAQEPVVIRPAPGREFKVALYQALRTDPAFRKAIMDVLLNQDARDAGIPSDVSLGDGLVAQHNAGGVEAVLERELAERGVQPTEPDEGSEEPGDEPESDCPF